MKGKAVYLSVVVVVGAISSEQPAITDIVPDPATFLDQTFDSLPFSQK